MTGVYFLLGNTPAVSNFNVNIISQVAAGDQTKRGPTKRKRAGH